MTNPLVDDRLVDFLLHEVHDAEGLARLPAFEDHGKETFDLFLASARRLAREVLFPSYRPMDQEPPAFDGKKITTHPGLPPIYRELVELGCVAATRPAESGGQGLPQLVYTLGSAYLMAGNLGAYCYAGLTAGAAHLIEAFGSDFLDETYRQPMLEGRYTGTMALTEPQAGSSLGDVATRATPQPDGTFRIKGSKIFISGGDHTMAENIVHLLLARIDGAPAGSKGISLFVVPAKRVEDGGLVDNDVTVAGMIHKIGWKALPSLALEFGDRDECVGWLCGEPGQGLRAMFQMMNEARLMVGVNGAATASVAYHESRQYALVRPQGRRGKVDGPQVPIVEHPDVRRMLLRQKAIVDGALSLLAETARYADLSEHLPEGEAKDSARLLLDLLTPIAKTFPAEYGFESNALAVQIHGGYGYTSEYLPEAFLRDQKLNSIHEGTTGIQSLDLLGRKVTAKGGAAVALLGAEMAKTAKEARALGVEAEDVAIFERAIGVVGSLTAELGARGAKGDPDGMLAHAFDYLTAVSILCVAWQHLKLRVAAEKKPAESEERKRFVEGLRAAERYWLRTEVPKIDHLAHLCQSAEDSYLRVAPETFA
ncbi:MAG: acyl-CoA dehydrogenase [Polyangiales bacterium]